MEGEVKLVSTIKLKKQTIEKLNGLKIHPRQTYDEIVTTLIQKYTSSMVTYTESIPEIK